MASASQSIGRHIGGTFTGAAGVAGLAGLAAAFGWFDLGFSIFRLQLLKFFVGVKRILDLKALRFVQSKVTAATWFCAICVPSTAYVARV